MSKRIILPLLKFLEQSLMTVSKEIVVSITTLKTRPFKNVNHHVLKRSSMAHNHS
jgi:hypothetical protein